MTTVRAMNFDDKEVIFEDVQEISQEMGDIRHIQGICSMSWLFGLLQCPDCRSVENKTCGKWFIVYSQRTDPGVIEVDGRPVKEVIEII